MKDRVSRYPGRVRLEPVPGQENIYDMERADEPTQAGDPLSKATLLPDWVASMYGLDENPQVKDALAAGIRALSDSWIKIESYDTAGAFTWTAPDLFHGRDYKIGIMVIGGGGSGGARLHLESSIGSSGRTGKASGGASGYSSYSTAIVSPGSTYNGVVGAGGEAVNGAVSNESSGWAKCLPGEAGGSTSFMSLLAQGGSGAWEGTSSNDVAEGGQPASAAGESPSAYPCSINPFGGVVVSSTASFPAPEFPDYLSCINPFEGARILGAGGGVYIKVRTSSTAIYYAPNGVGPDGKGGSSAVCKYSTDLQDELTGERATSPGCGGGGALMLMIASELKTGSVTSGAGADGAVYIYVQGGRV